MTLLVEDEQTSHKTISSPKYGFKTLKFPHGFQEFFKNTVGHTLKNRSQIRARIKLESNYDRELLVSCRTKVLMERRDCAKKR